MATESTSPTTPAKDDPPTLSSNELDATTSAADVPAAESAAAPSFETANEQMGIPFDESNSKRDQKTREDILDKIHAHTYYEPSKLSDIKTYDYASNKTVFGKILRGELKTRLFLETDHLIAIEDKTPRAPLHGLILPKRLIPSVFDLSSDLARGHIALLKEMETTAETLLKDKQPEAFEKGDYLLCFHVPPFNSVDHLHLHVLAPLSKMESWMSQAEFNQVGRWNITLDEVLIRLQTGKPSTPYNIDSWMSIVSETFSSILEMVIPSKETIVMQTTDLIPCSPRDGDQTEEAGAATDVVTVTTTDTRLTTSTPKGKKWKERLSAKKLQKLKMHQQARDKAVQEPTTTTSPQATTTPAQ